MTTITDTSRATIGSGFTASPTLGDDLQQVLVDLIGLQLQAKQAHWNVVGHNFRDMHLQLDEVTEVARDGADTIAERMRALGAVADGRAPTIAATASLTPLPAGELGTSAVVDLITGSLRTVVADIRRVHDEVDREDPSTSDLLHGIVVELEKQAWMLSAENRTA
jgi:starvation-inducible DNA-binding protein